MPKNGRIAPTRLRIETSSICQLKCPSCPTTTGAIRPAIGSGTLRLDDFRQLLDDNPSVREIELSNYGEIFLNRELVSILECAHAKGVSLTATNGVNLNHARDEVLEALVRYGVRRITCSIDGASEETYQRYRVGGSLERVLANVRRINHHKLAHRTELPRLTWQFVVFGHNEHEIEAARTLASELDMELQLKLSWDETFSPPSDASLSRTAFARTHGHEYLSEICHQLWDQPQINWDGKVLGCCRNFWGEFGGNAFRDGLEASINSDGMSHARRMLRGEATPRDDIPCTTCSIYISRRELHQWIEPDSLLRRLLRRVGVTLLRAGFRASS